MYNSYINIEVRGIVIPKSKEELNKIKEEYDNLNNKLKELSEEELIEVVGGTPGEIDIRVRGIGIAFGASSLYLVDGVESPNNIKPEDIESIDVLK